MTEERDLLLRREFDEVTLPRLVAYAGAAGEVGVTHYDRAAARAAGHEDVTAHGMYAAGLIGVGLAEEYGPRSVRDLKVRFAAVLEAGDTPVLEVWTGQEPRQGQRALDFALTADDRVVAHGSAEVAADGGLA
jgi:acyl dehydratase